MTTENSKPADAFRYSSSSLSVPGNVRKANEDSILDLPASGLWVVADGMGGHNAGDVASRMIVDELSGLRRMDRPSALVEAIDDGLRRVNRRLHESSALSGGLSGSTVVVLATFQNYVACLWAGDSRLYRLRAGKLDQVTRDHSEVEEFVDQGRGPEETAAANVITRAVGGTEELALDFELAEIEDGDEFLLCSDGLYRELSDEDIAGYLRREPEDACRAMIDHALAGACSDNVSVIVVRFAAKTGRGQR